MINQRVGCLLCSMARIYDLWDGTLDKRISLFPCCDHDAYQAQVPQQPIVLADTISLPFARFVISLIQSRII